MPSGVERSKARSSTPSTSNPFSSSTRARAAPIPDEAPVTRAYGWRAGPMAQALPNSGDLLGQLPHGRHVRAQPADALVEGADGLAQRMEVGAERFDTRPHGLQRIELGVHRLDLLAHRGQLLDRLDPGREVVDATGEPL